MWMHGTDQKTPSAQDPRTRWSFEGVVQWTREQQALSPAGGRISKLKDGSVKEGFPVLLVDEGRAISGW